MIPLLVACGPSPVSTPSMPSSSTDTPFEPFVETLVESAGSDDLTWHPDGFLLASDLIGTGAWPSNPNGTEVLRVDPDTGSLSPWGTDAPRPIGSALAPDGTLYVAGYGASAGVWAIPPGGGVASLVVDGLSYPSMVAFADDEALLVTEWGLDRVSRLVDGVVEPFAEVPGAVGIDRNAAGDLVVGANDGWLYRLDADGTAARWAELPDGDPADFAVAGTRTYVTTLFGHQIWEVDPDGTVRKLSGGRNPGSDDGPLSDASFDTPNGIAASPDGARLFVQQLDKRLRVIHLR